MKTKITLIKLGNAGNLVDFNKVSKWTSELFEIIEPKSIDHLPGSDIDDGYLDQKYTTEKLKELISCPDDSDFAVAIMSCRFVDNFYVKRVSEKCAVISLYGIPQILQSENISIENFIIKQLYEIYAIKSLVKDLSDDEAVFKLLHRDTRGCLFDMNGDRMDILQNVESPMLCDSCKSEFKKKQTNPKIISTLEKELKRIKKPQILRIERFIKKSPLLSVLLSALVAIFLNLVASGMWEFLKLLVE